MQPGSDEILWIIGVDELFEVTRRPYVVRNPQAGAAVSLEVPWREGNATRSARRSELLTVFHQPSFFLSWSFFVAQDGVATWR
jgi:hypothetical protein